MSNLLDRISINPNICHGKPCIKGTRIMVYIILDNLAEDVPEEEILDGYPSLTHDDIRAAMAYTAEMIREEHVPIPITYDP